MNIVWNTYDVEGTFAHEFTTGSIHQNIVAGAGYRRKFVDTTIFDAPHHENHDQGFVQDSIRIGARMTVVAGIRVDRPPLIDRPVFSPRGAIVGRIGQRQAIRASVATAFRTPSFIDSYVSVLTGTPISAVARTRAGARSIIASSGRHA